MYTRDVEVGGPVRVRARHQPPEDGRDMGGAEPLPARQQQPVHLRGGQAPIILSLRGLLYGTFYLSSVGSLSKT